METLSDDGGQLYELASPVTHPEPTAPPFPCSRATDGPLTHWANDVSHNKVPLDM